MSRWREIASGVRIASVVSAVGGLYVVLAVARVAVLAPTGAGALEVASGTVLIGLPGFVLLYWGYQFPVPDPGTGTHSRVVGWSLGGV